MRKRSFILAATALTLGACGGVGTGGTPTSTGPSAPPPATTPAPGPTAAPTTPSSAPAGEPVNPAASSSMPKAPESPSGANPGGSTGR